MPTCSLVSHSPALELPRGRRPRHLRGPVRVTASRGDEKRSSNGGKDERCSTPMTSSSFAQRAAAGAGALLLSLSPTLLLPPPPAWPATPTTTTTTKVKYLTRDELSTVELFKRATPSVVFVTALGERRDALTLDVTQMPQGAGSGVVWDAEGHVVTNYHVVKDAMELRVTVSGGGGGSGSGSGSSGGGSGGGGEFRAKLVGADPDRDVALLELAPFADPSPEDDEQEEETAEFASAMDPEEEADTEFGGEGGEDEAGGDEAAVVAIASPSSSSSSSSSPSTSSSSSPPPSRPSPRPSRLPNLRPRPPLVPLRRGTSAGLEVGQTVYAIGNPFGLSSTLTKGVLSGVGREIASGITGRPLENVLQSDAAINPGNSGGPLLDSSGAMIGVNVAIYSASGGSNGVGFAIPIDSVVSSVNDLLKFGKVVRPILGIALAPEQASDTLGVKGILVLDARKGGPAADAGIKGTTRDRYGRVVFGDVIRRFNGKVVRTPNDLYRALENAKIGQEVELGLLRDGVDKEVSVKVTLAASSPQ